MITQAISLVAAMYGAIGPGLVLVAALPVFLAAFVLVTRASVKRARGGT
jgi:hypothetical protein